jgi:hypothetical protein
MLACFIATYITEVLRCIAITLMPPTVPAVDGNVGPTMRHLPANI